MRPALAVLSAALLAHQIVLLRALAIAWWSHAAALVVSVALLGFGAAGTLLAVAPALRRPRTVALAAAAYALLASLSLRAAAAVDFNVLEVGWDAGQWGRLLVLQGVFLLPFLAGALGVLTALALEAGRAGAVYGVNLLGSGAGALLAIPLLAWGPPEQVLVAVAVAAALGAAFVPGRAPKVAAAVGALGAGILGGAGLPMSAFKDLPATPGLEILATRFGPLGRVDRGAAPALHHAPGLSLVAEALPPPQHALFVDGHRVAVLDVEPSAWLQESVLHLPGVLRSEAGGPILALGLVPGAWEADRVVVAHPGLIELAGLGARAVATEPRAWLGSTTERFGVIRLEAGEGDPAHETPLLTVEGLGAALARLEPGGVLLAGARLQSPPRRDLRLLLTAEAVTPHVVAMRSMGHLAVAMSREPFDDAALARAGSFADRMGFDVLRPRAARTHPPHHEVPVPLEPPAAGYPYDVRPVTDARPYFHRSFRWGRVGDLFDRRAVPFVEWAFVALVVGFVQVSALAALLLLGPLLLRRAARAPAPLFLALGIAYMAVEMAFLARAHVRLGGPALGAAVVIGGFLVGSGLGSLAGERLGRPLRAAALLAAFLVPLGFALFPRAPVLAALTCLAVSFPMGMPFPAALARLPERSVAWALAINGFASVAAAAGAPLLSTTAGIPATLAAGAVLYLLVAALYRAKGGLPAGDRSRA